MTRQATIDQILILVCADINNNNFEFENNSGEQPIPRETSDFFGLHLLPWPLGLQYTAGPGVRIFPMVDLLLTLGAILLLGVVANIAVKLLSAWENQTHKRDW